MPTHRAMDGEPIRCLGHRQGSVRVATGHHAGYEGGGEMALERKNFRGVYKKLAITVVAMALFASGCKTQEDAAAAAKQMASTSRELSDYYLSLDHILAE